MPNYRRANRPGGTFFLTLVTERRAPIFESEIVRALLRPAIEHCRRMHPFVLEAIVLLYDHPGSVGFGNTLSVMTPTAFAISITFTTIR
jgi:hypothetical protein